MHLDEKSSPMVPSVVWSLAADTSEVVGECNRCGAELRFSTNTSSVELTFKHEAECSWMRELEERTRARELTRNLAHILDDKLDSEEALPGLVFVVRERDEAA